MPQATFSLTIPESIWLGAISREYPEAVLRVLAAIAGDGDGTGLVEIRASDPAPIADAFERADPVGALEILHEDDDRVLIQFETSQPLLLMPVQKTGVPLQTPFDIVDGTAEWEITASHTRLSDLGEQFEAMGIPYDLTEVRQELDTEQLLSETQRDLVEEALERGYYDTPRTCTLVALADALDMAPSTVSETLHRAEERMIKEIMDWPD